MNSFCLHIIAMLLMVIDHIGIAFPELSIILRIIGRISFPIFCFMIAEGWAHTSNKKKYLKRMFIFAVISEIPFNMFLSGNIFYSDLQNVMFTFLISMACMYIVEKKPKLSFFIRLIAIALAIFLKTDYSAFGVITVIMFFEARGNIKLQLLCLIIINAVQSIYYEWPIQMFSILSVIFIYFYNGEKGNYSKFVRYSFYAFYPLHMILLFIIKQ